MRGEFQIRRAGAADAREIASINVAATRSAYRVIYSDAYLAELTVAERVCAWTAAGKGRLAAGGGHTRIKSEGMLRRDMRDPIRIGTRGGFTPAPESLLSAHSR
jgi:hypothetical protein